DLEGTQLNIWQYRKIMEKMMSHGGLTPAPTDDPEIISHPANCLMVRIGNNVCEESIKQFDTLRFLTRHKQRHMKGGVYNARRGNHAKECRSITTYCCDCYSEETATRSPNSLYSYR